MLSPVFVSGPDLLGYGNFWLNVIGPPTLVAGRFGISRTANSASQGGRTFVVCWEKVLTDPTLWGVLVTVQVQLLPAYARMVRTQRCTTPPGVWGVSNVVPACSAP